MTSLNSPFPVPEGRRPFFRVLANKAPIINVAEVEVRLNQHFTSDRYTVTLPLWGQPLPMNYAWWATQTDIEIEILAGFVNARGVAGYQSLIVGTIDDIEEDWGNGKLLLNGRDYSGMFIESVTDGENFFDMTPAAAAAAIAANQQGKYLDVYRDLMADHSVDADSIDQILTKNGLEPKRTLALAADPKIAAQIADVSHLASSLGVQGTPGFLVNDQYVSGADIEALKKAIAAQQKG